MNLVYRHESGGGLFQGDVDDIRMLIDETASVIQVVVLSAIEFQPDLPTHYETIKVPLIDSVSLSDHAEALTAAIASVNAERVVAAVSQGRHVLVSCAAGLNRSGLISCLSLMKLGVSSREAIAKVRSARGPAALCNYRFTEIIHKLGDRWQLSTELKKDD